MKYKAPDGIGGFSIGDTVFDLSTGIVDASDPVVVDALLTHGFVPVGDAQAAGVSVDKTVEGEWNEMNAAAGEAAAAKAPKSKKAQ